MGMSIDEAIEILQGRDKRMEYVTDNDSEAFEIAIDTMRKYQKIEAHIKCLEEENAEFVNVSSIRELLNGNN